MLLIGRDAVTKEKYCNNGDAMTMDAVTMEIVCLTVHGTDGSREFSSAPDTGSVHIMT